MKSLGKKIAKFFRSDKGVIHRVTKSFSDGEVRCLVDFNGDPVIGPAFIDCRKVLGVHHSLHQAKFKITPKGSSYSIEIISFLHMQFSEEVLSSACQSLANIIDVPASSRSFRSDFFDFLPVEALYLIRKSLLGTKPGRFQHSQVRS